VNLKRAGLVLILLGLFSLLPDLVAAQVKALIIGVQDKSWTGHYRWVLGELTGMDADLVRIVAGKLGYEVRFKPLPWARVLMMAEEQSIDGVLDVAPTRDRKRFLHYVVTPISAESTVFWVKVGSPFRYTGKFDPGMRIGLMLGSDWSDRFAREGMPTVVRFDSTKAAFKTLEAGRIDAFGGHLAPTREDVTVLGFTGVIEPSEPIISNLPYYLALSKRPGHEDLADAFASQLLSFYKSDEYTEFLKKQGISDVDRGFYPPPLVKP